MSLVSMIPTTLLFYLLLILCALNTTHNAVYNQCILFINNDFQASSYQLRLTLTVYFSAIFLCRCFLCYLSDNCRAKKCILISLSIAVLGHLLAACSSNIYVFILARLLQGLGLGGGQVMSMMLLFKVFSKKQRASIVASEQVFFSLASVFLPLTAHFLSSRLSWRLTFICYLSFTICAILYFIYAQPKDYEEPQLSGNNTTPHTPILKNLNFLAPTFLACFSFSGYILWGSYFSLLVRHYQIPLPYLLMYQLIPIIPYFTFSLLFKQLTAHLEKRALRFLILWIQMGAFIAIISLLFWDKTANSFKFLLLIPILLHNVAGAFFRPLMQEKALSFVPNERIGFASSFISICQVGVNATFSIILNCISSFIIGFVVIQCFIGGTILSYLYYQQFGKKSK